VFHSPDQFFFIVFTLFVRTAFMTSISTPTNLERSFPDTELSLQVLTEKKQVEEIAAEWDALLQCSVCNPVFSSSIWYLAALEVQEDASPYVPIVRRKGVLAGILPLVLNHREHRAEFPEFANDYCDLIAEPQDDVTISALLRCVLGEDSKFETVFLDRMRADSNCFRGLERLLSHQRLMELFVPDRQAYPFVKTCASYEDYLVTRRGKFRRNLLRARRHAQENVQIQLQIQIEELLPADLGSIDLAELFLSLHLARFCEKTPFRARDRQALLHQLLPALFAQKLLRAFVVKKQGKIVAIDICFKGVNSLCAWNGGFLPEAAECSPGMLLIDFELRSAFEAKLPEFDLLRGSEEYKASWATDLRVVGSVELPKEIRMEGLQPGTPRQ